MHALDCIFIKSAHVLLTRFISQKAKEPQHSQPPDNDERKGLLQKSTHKDVFQNNSRKKQFFGETKPIAIIYPLTDDAVTIR